MGIFVGNQDQNQNPEFLNGSAKWISQLSTVWTFRRPLTSPPTAWFAAKVGRRQESWRRDSNRPQNGCRFVRLVSLPKMGGFLLASLLKHPKMGCLKKQTEPPTCCTWDGLSLPLASSLADVRTQGLATCRCLVAVSVFELLPRLFGTNSGGPEETDTVIVGMRV